MNEIEFVQADGAILAQLMAWHADEKLNVAVGAGKGAAGRALSRQALHKMVTAPPPDMSMLVVAEDHVPIAYVIFSHINEPHKTAQIHITVSPDHRENGVGRRIMSAALDRAFAKGLYRIEGKPIFGNKPAFRLLESLGFTLECIEKASIWTFDGPKNRWSMRMTKPEWERRNGRERKVS